MKNVMSVKRRYRLAVDRLAYMIVYAPNFPTRRRQTFDEAFAELYQWLDEIAARETKEVSLVGISKCRDAVLRAKELYGAGDEDGGGFAIQSAHRYLEFAAKGKPAPDLLF